MALKTDYKDDVLDTSVNTTRKYKMITNDDGTVSFEDVTEYLQTGDSFGAQEINELVGRILTFTNMSVATSAWTNTSDGSDYPYVATITCKGMTTNHVPSVTFSLNDATSGVFAPVAESGTDTVKIYASEIPSGTVTIPVIQGVK